MIKTGKRLSLLSFFLLLLNLSAIAQNTQVTATLSNDKIFPGEQVKLTLEIKGAGSSNLSQPDLPEIPGLTWVVNSTERSTNYTIINGRPSVTYTFGYRLVAGDPGSYEIPSLTININEKVYTTESIAFEIIDRDQLASDDPNRYPDVFVEVELDDESPVPGQQLIASIILYFKDGIEVASYQPTPGWKAEGFWKEALDDVRSPIASSVIKGGIRFRKAKLLQYALFPTKSGELELSPFEVTLSIRNRNRRTSFFDLGANQSRIAVQSEALKLTVDALPNLDDAIYLGAVGDFKVNRSITTSEALVGESVEVVTEIEGSGNVPLIPKPEFEYPSGLEQYEPQETSNITRRGDQISGSKKFSDILIARNPGEYVIPAINVAYYNPVRNRYEIEELPELILNAKRDPDALVVSIESMQLDVKPVKGLTTWEIRSEKRLVESFYSWFLLALPIIVMGLGYVISNRKFKMENDVDFARSQHAFKKAISILEEVDFNTAKVKDGYASIHKSLTGFIADKLALGEGTLSDKVYIDHLSKASINNELLKNIKQLLTTCSTISYIPNASSETLQDDLEMAKSIINQLKKEL